MAASRGQADARVATEAVRSGFRDCRQAAVLGKEAARHGRADARNDGEHDLGLGGGMARSAARAFGAHGRSGPPRALREPDAPRGAVVGVEAVQHGEPVLDQPAHGTTPGVLGDVARLALDQQHGLVERRLQPLRLVEDAAVADRGAEVGGTLALDGETGAEHVVADGEVRQLDVEPGGDQGLRDRAAALAMVDQHRTRLHALDATRPPQAARG